MKYYTEIVPSAIAEILKQAGFPQENGHEWYNFKGEKAELDWERFITAPTYAEAFDWLTEKRHIIMVVPTIDPKDFNAGGKITTWDGWHNGEKICEGKTWHAAANRAIAYALPSKPRTKDYTTAPWHNPKKELPEYGGARCVVVYSGEEYEAIFHRSRPDSGYKDYFMMCGRAYDYDCFKAWRYYKDID